MLVTYLKSTSGYIVLIIVIFKFLFKLTGKFKCLNKHYHLPQQAFFLALMVWNLISTKTSIKCHHQGETKILISTSDTRPPCSRFSRCSIRRLVLSRMRQQSKKKVSLGRNILVNVQKRSASRKSVAVSRSDCNKSGKLQKMLTIERCRKPNAKRRSVGCRKRLPAWKRSDLWRRPSALRTSASFMRKLIAFRIRSNMKRRRVIKK